VGEDLSNHSSLSRKLAMDGTTGSVPSTATKSEYGSRTRFPLPIPLPLHSYIWRKNIELLLEVARRFALIIKPICGVRLFDDIHGPGFIYREESIGFWESVLYFIGILNTESVRQLHWNINCWTDKQFFTWKKTYVANCIAIAVAVSLDVSSKRMLLITKPMAGCYPCNSWTFSIIVAEHGPDALDCSCAILLQHAVGNLRGLLRHVYAADGGVAK
jgi:hypothetical protein